MPIGHKQGLERSCLSAIDIWGAAAFLTAGRHCSVSVEVSLIRRHSPVDASSFNPTLAIFGSPSMWTMSSRNTTHAVHRLGIGLSKGWQSHLLQRCRYVALVQRCHMCHAVITTWHANMLVLCGAMSCLEAG